MTELTDIGMDSAIEKCVIIIMKIRNQHKTERIQLPHENKIRTFGGKEIHKYLQISVARAIKRAEWKKEYKNNTSRNQKKNRNQAK